VAVGVPDPWGLRLQERRAEYGDPRAWTIPTHITLLPPTQVRPSTAADVDAHLSEVAEHQKPFPVRLAGTDTFRPVTQTSFIVVTDGAAECTDLADAVRAGPLRRRLPFPYHPHVTLAVDLSDAVHDLAEADFRSFELTFEVTALERYQLTDYGVWEPVAAFGFGGAVR
jgi:2'-5' RNA ligase